MSSSPSLLILPRILFSRFSEVGSPTVRLVGCLITLAIGLQGCAKSEDSPEVLLQRGNLLLSQGRYADAEEVHRRAIEGFLKYLEDEPDNPYLHYTIGTIYQGLGEVDKALEAYTQSIRFNPNSAVAFNDRGFLLFSARNDLEAALRDFNEAIRLDPSDVLPLHNRGWLQFQIGNYESALADLDMVLLMSPDAIAYLHRGDIRRELKNLEGAIADYTQALRLDADLPEALFGRGLALRELGRMDDATADIERALTLDPGLSLPAGDPSSLTDSIMETIPSAYTATMKYLESEGYAEVEFTLDGAFHVRGSREGQLVLVHVALETPAGGEVLVSQSILDAIEQSETPVDLVVVAPPAPDRLAPEVIRLIRDWNPATMELRPVEFAVTLP